MEVTVEDVGGCTKKLLISVSTEEVDKVYEEIYNEYRHEIVIPGFRRGRFPRKLFERKFSSSIEKDVRERIKENCLQEALEGEKLTAVVPPRIEEREFRKGEPFEFTAEVEIEPEFDVPPLGEITLSYSGGEITDEMVDEEVTRLRETFPSYTREEGAAVEEGDRVRVSFEITVGEESLEAMEDVEMYAEKEDFRFGATDEFPACILGKKEGEAFSCGFVLPPFFHREEYRNKEAQMKGTVRLVEKKVIPAPDDSRFLSAVKCETLDELKRKIRGRLEQVREAARREAFREQIREYFNEKADFDLPPSLVEREKNGIRNRMRRRLLNEGIKDEELEKRLDEAAEEIEDEARKSLKNYFIFKKIADENTIVVTEEEVDARVAVLAAERNVTPADMKQYLASLGGIDALRVELREEKTLDFIISKAGTAAPGSGGKKGDGKKEKEGKAE